MNQNINIENVIILKDILKNIGQVTNYNLSTKSHGYYKLIDKPTLINCRPRDFYLNRRHPLAF